MRPAPSLFRYLEEEEIQEITKEISRLGRIEPETADGVLDDYYKMALARSYLMQGGVDYARKLLVKAFGPEASKKLLDRVTLAIQSSIGRIRQPPEGRSGAALEVHSERTPADDRPRAGPSALQPRPRRC